MKGLNLDSRNGRPAGKPAPAVYSRLLSSLDPTRAGHWQSGADFSRDMQSTIERVRENMQQVEAMELKKDHPKRCRWL